MRSATAAPFLTADPARVAGGVWFRVLDPEPIELEDMVSGLDYLSVLELARHVSVDVSGIRADCRLANEIPLSISASWTASGTHLRRSLYSAPLPAGEPRAAFAISGAVPADAASGLLTIETKISLAQTASAPHPMAATQAGSVLWSDSQNVSLDGTASFFPMQLAKFDDPSATWAQPDAAWCLIWPSLELDRPFLGSVKLLVNSSHPSVAKAVAGVAGTKKESHAIRAAIYFDVARSLMLGALNNPEFIECDGDYPRGSCGRAANDLLRVHFPSDSLASLRDTARSAPEFFSADLQSKLRLFWGTE